MYQLTVSTSFLVTVILVNLFSNLLKRLAQYLEFGYRPICSKIEIHHQFHEIAIFNIGPKGVVMPVG